MRTQVNIWKQLYKEVLSVYDTWLSVLWDSIEEINEFWEVAKELSEVQIKATPGTRAKCDIQEAKQIENRGFSRLNLWRRTKNET